MDMQKAPSAQEFHLKFFEVLRECLPNTPERQSEAYKHWTAFMTGKGAKNAGFGESELVLPVTACKLGLQCQPENLGLDLVFYCKGEPWGNLVAVEHENDLRVAENGFGGEVVKLMSVLAPLKIGITYIWENQNENLTTQLTKLIQDYFKNRHPQIREASETEYLFLLGIMRNNILKWKYLSFNCAATPSQFQDAGEQFHVFHTAHSYSARVAR
jgi:hypothetical protein